MDAEGRELTIHSVRITQRHRVVAITNLRCAYSQAYYQETLLKPSPGLYLISQTPSETRYHESSMPIPQRQSAPMSEAVTHSIRVEVMSQYSPENSKPLQDV